MIGVQRKTLITLITFLLAIFTVNAATLTCQQISDTSLDIPQFSSKTIEIQCSASGGTVSNVQITPNSNPTTGVSITSSETISSSISDSSSGTGKWSVEGDSPNTYSISYTISSDGTESWTGASTTQVEVTSPAQLQVSYVSAPSEYTSGDTLDVMISNIGGTTANSVKLQLNSGSKKSYPTSISAGSSASYSWTSSTGYSTNGTFLTKVYISDTLHDSDTTIVAEGTPPVCGNNIKESGEECDGTDLNSQSCTTKNFDTGTLSCGSCSFVTSACENNTVPPNDNDNDNTDSPGSGGSAGESTTETLDFDNLTDEGIMSIDNSYFPFTKVTFDVSSSVIDAKLTAKSYSSLGTDYPNVTGTVYKYQELSSDKIEEVLDSVSVKFKVEKTWVTDNEADKDRMFLLRYNGNNWIEETTVLTDSDDDYYYYSSSFEKFGMYSIAYVEPVELEYVAMSNLVPDLIDTKMVIESSLKDAVMIEKIEGYVNGKLNVKKTIELSKEFVEKMYMKRDVKSTTDSSVMTISFKNNHDKPVSFLFVEAVPKTIVHDVFALKDFVPRKYDLIVREDPVIQWSFGKADTSIVMWEIKDLGVGEEATFSYSLDAVFTVEKYPAPILIVPVIETGSVVAEDGSDKSDEGLTSDDLPISPGTKKNGILLISILIIVAIAFIVHNMYSGKSKGGSTTGAQTAAHHPPVHEDRVSNGAKPKAAGFHTANSEQLTQITSFIKSQKSKGLGNDDIKKKLSEVNWDPKSIDEAFSKAN